MANFILIGILQGIFLAWFCFVNRNMNRVGFISLTWLLISFILVLSEQWSRMAELPYSWLIHAKRSTTWMPFLLGPFFYFACRSTTLNESRFRRTDGLHLLPALIHFLYLIPYYASPAAEKLAKTYETPTDVTVFATFKSIQIVTYLLLARKLLAEKQLTDKSGLMLILKRTLDIFLACMLLVISSFYFEVFNGEGFISSDEFTSLLLSAFFIFFSYFYVIYWKKFAMAQNGKTVDSIGDEKDNEKTQLDTIYQEIHRHIMNNKLFTNPELRMEDLSKSMGLSLHYLSYAINQCAGVNFQTYINRARVEFVKNLIQNHQGKMSLLNLANDAGFNSKASFNRVFKQQTNMTPSQFKDSLHNS